MRTISWDPSSSNMQDKASDVDSSHKRARDRNARLGSNYWCEGAYESGKRAAFDDFAALLAAMALTIPDEHADDLSECVESTYGLFGYTPRSSRSWAMTLHTSRTLLA